MWKPNSKIRIQISLEHFVKHLMGTNLLFSKTGAKIVVEARELEPFSPLLSTLPTIHPLATPYSQHGRPSRWRSMAAMRLSRTLSLSLAFSLSLTPDECHSLLCSQTRPP